jgi:hypothetical protein
MHRRGPRGAEMDGPQGPEVSDLDVDDEASDL